MTAEKINTTHSFGTVVSFLWAVAERLDGENGLLLAATQERA